MKIYIIEESYGVWEEEITTLIVAFVDKDKAEAFVEDRKRFLPPLGASTALRRACAYELGCTEYDFPYYTIKEVELHE